MIAYITKYALTKGIFEIEASICSDVSPDLIREGVPGSHGILYHGEGHEWHRTRESAIKKANEMKAAKLESLNRQIKKLSAITFE